MTLFNDALNQFDENGAEAAIAAGLSNERFLCLPELRTDEEELLLLAA